MCTPRIFKVNPDSPTYVNAFWKALDLVPDNTNEVTEWVEEKLPTLDNEKETHPIYNWCPKDLPIDRQNLIDQVSYYFELACFMARYGNAKPTQSCFDGDQKLSHETWDNKLLLKLASIDVVYFNEQDVIEPELDLASAEQKKLSPEIEYQFNLLSNEVIIAIFILARACTQLITPEHCVVITPVNANNLLLTCAVLAGKFLEDDLSPNFNDKFADEGKISCKLLNNFEGQLFLRFEYDLALFLNNNTFKQAVKTLLIEGVHTLPEFKEIFPISKLTKPDLKLIEAFKQWDNLFEEKQMHHDASSKDIILQKLKPHKNVPNLYRPASPDSPDKLVVLSTHSFSRSP